MTKFKTLKLLITTFLILFASQIIAQSLLFGRITDQSNGEPLAGVNIYFPELLKGSVSNKDGDYRIENLPKGELIVRISFVGYKTENIKIHSNNQEQNIDIELEFLIVQGQEIVVSGNFTSTQHENTVKISTLNSRQLNQSGKASLIESIEKTPGIDLISKGPGIGSPVIRGLSLSNILFLNNGIPMNNYQFSENHPYLVDEFGVKRVEIIKGPASLIYGSGAVGGVINIIDEEPAMKGSIKGNMGFKYFGNTSGISGNIAIKGNSKNIFWGIQAGKTSHKDYKQGNNEFVPNTRFNRNSIKLNTGLIRKKSTYKIIYQYSNDNLGLAVEPAIDLVKTNGRKNDVWFQDLSDHLIISQNKFFLNKFRLDVNAAYQQNNRKLNATKTVSPFTIVNMKLSTFSFCIKGNYQFNENLSLIIGTQNFIQKNTNADAPNRILPDANIFDASFYSLAQYKIENRFVLEAGLRYSYKTIGVPLQEPSGHSHEEEHGEEDDDLIEFNGTFSNLSASIGTTINLNEEMLLRLNLASAFRSPNLAELTQHGMHGNRFEVGNADLTNQQNLEADIGFHLHTKHTTIDLSAFYNNIYNYIFLSPTNDSTEEGNRIYKYLQTPSVIYGGEAMLHIHPHPIHWLHIQASYSYLVGKKKSKENLPLIPANNLKLDVMFTKDKLNILKHTYFKIGFKYAFEQNKPSEFETSTDSYFLINLGLGTEIKINNQLINIDLTANNLLNEVYYDHLSTLKDLSYYDMGRSINISVKIPFGIRK
jgi:iron complex outermembrane receptor protein